MPPIAQAPLRRLNALAPLSPDERALVGRVLAVIEHHRAGAKILPEGAPLDRPRLIVSGWAARTHTLRDGRRQILDYYLPGEIMGHCARDGARALGNYLALTRLESADARALCAAVAARPDAVSELALALRLSEALEENYLLSQIVRAGRQSAYERFAHLMLEFQSRLRLSGLVEGTTFQMPLTQEALGDGLGLSIVHINRTVQQLRREQLIRIGGGMVTLLDPEGLAAIAEFREPSLPQADSRTREAGGLRESQSRWAGAHN